MEILKGLKLVAFAAVVIFGVPGLGPDKAHATTMSVGCAGGTFGADCGLDELIAGGSFTINDKLFTNWRLQLFSGRLMDASVIRVDFIDSISNPGFVLTDTENTWRAEDGDVTQNDLFFLVTVTGGPLSIVDNELIVEFGDIVNAGGDPFAEVTETVFGSGGFIAFKEAFCGNPSCANQVISDRRVFAPQKVLQIAKTIDVVALDPGDVAEINKITQTFSQAPEPGTLTLLGVGTLGLLGYGWRRRKRGNLA